MNNNIVLGSYLPYNTIIHRLDPRIKFLSLIIFIAAIFISAGWESYIYMSSILIFLFILAKIPKQSIITIFKSIIFVFIFLLLINIFVNKQGVSILTINTFKIYSGAITTTVYIIWRIVLMMTITIILTATTKPLDLTLALEDIFTPLKYLKFPVHAIAMILAIALRFIPTLIEETNRIMKAQASRGVDYSNGNVKEKTKSLISLIIPLFVSAFQKADDLANAMEARNYDPYSKRTRYTQFHLKFSDYVTFIMIVSLLLLVIFTHYHMWNGVLNWLEPYQGAWKPSI